MHTPRWPRRTLRPKSSKARVPRLAARSASIRIQRRPSGSLSGRARTSRLGPRGSADVRPCPVRRHRHVPGDGDMVHLTQVHTMVQLRRYDATDAR